LQGSLYENQKGMKNRFFDRPVSAPRELAAAK
jgi:hypothetical protein